MSEGNHNSKRVKNSETNRRNFLKTGVAFTGDAEIGENV